VGFPLTFWAGLQLLAVTQTPISRTVWKFGYTCNDGSVSRLCRLSAVLGLMVLGAACSTTSTSTGSGSPTETGSAGLRAAAIAWSNAFLTGTVADIRGMEASACQVGGPTIGSSVVEACLRAMRAALEHHFGVPLGSIRFTGVELRNVTATTGDAEVQYDLPASVVGNDNWVSYSYQHGQWKETNCHAPIGGESSSSTALTP
jgi:hypothetical protein